MSLFSRKIKIFLALCLASSLFAQPSSVWTRALQAACPTASPIEQAAHWPSAARALRGCNPASDSLCHWLQTEEQAIAQRIAALPLHQQTFLATDTATFVWAQAWPWWTALATDTSQIIQWCDSLDTRLCWGRVEDSLRLSNFLQKQGIRFVVLPEPLAAWGTTAYAQAAQQRAVILHRELSSLAAQRSPWFRAWPFALLGLLLGLALAGYRLRYSSPHTVKNNPKS